MVRPRDPRERFTRAQEVIELAVWADDPEIELNGRLWPLHALRKQVMRGDR